MARIAFALLGLFLLLGGPAEAHKLSLFAAATGPVIEGKAYFKGGQGARGIAIRILGPDGDVLATTETDSEGRFSFTASRRVDHVIVADVGDGHQTHFTLAAAELPGGLPGPTGQAEVPKAAATAAVQETAPAPDVEKRIEEAVARQVHPLREQIAALEDQIRLRDIIGGIGYIFGIAGLLAWLGARRRGGSR